MGTSGRQASAAALLFLLLAAGCAEAPVPALPIATPFPAARRAGAWQQFCEQAWNVPHASALVAARGADGWELVAMYNGVVCYKRPAPEPALARPDGRAPQPAPGSGGQLPVFRDPGF